MSKCIRCGKQRIASSSYEETVEKVTVMYTITVCPDDACQKIVEQGLVVEEKKRKYIRDEQEKRLKQQAEKRKADKELTKN